MSYLFTSERLGFRNWLDADLSEMTEINKHSEVMKYFPSTQDKAQTIDFVMRMQKMFIDKGYCYFAVEELAFKQFIGFIGLAHQTYEAEFTPCTDIGWRLHPKYWNKGYATEGAKACLDYGFNKLNLKQIVSIAPVINKPSISVMQKIGMSKVNTFKHPSLSDFSELQECVLYSLTN